MSWARSFLLIPFERREAADGMGPDQPLGGTEGSGGLKCLPKPQDEALPEAAPLASVKIHKPGGRCPASSISSPFLEALEVEGDTRR